MLPPVYSPLSLRALVSGAATVVSWRHDRLDELRRLLARTYAADTVVLCSSGTAALQLALRVGSQLRPGSDVALPAFGCYDLATAAIGAGLPVRAYDLDPDTLGPDLDSLDDALAQGALITIVAPLYGYPVDWEAISECARRSGAVLIEDAAQADGASWRGRPVGTLGSISVVSFGRGKGWTGGKGGALLLRGDAAVSAFERLAPRLPPPARSQEIRMVMAAAAQWVFARPWLYAIPSMLPGLGLGQTRYRDPEAPAALSPASATILWETAGRLGGERIARRHNAEMLAECLRRLSFLKPIAPLPGAMPGYIRLPVRSRFARDLVATPSVRRAGIVASYPKPLTSLGPLRASLRNQTGHWSGAVALSNELLTLPTHSRVGMRGRERMLRVLYTCRPDAQRRAWRGVPDWGIQLR